MRGFPGLDVGLLREQVAELVGAREEHALGERVDLEVDGRAVRQEDALLGEVDGELGIGLALEQLEQSLVRDPVDDDRQDAVLEAVVAEDVGERRGQDRLHAPRRERPGRVLAGRPGAEVVADEQDPAPGHLRSIDDERRLLERTVLLEPPVPEEGLGQPGLVRDLEIASRDDLVRVDVLGRDRDGAAREDGERLAHRMPQRPPTAAIASMPGRRRGSATTPAIALAAAVSGDARKVRPPLPCRPSKLRLLVLTAYWPGDSWSPFIAMHIEQPASRQSAPAARKISSRPSRSASRFTSSEPGTTISRTPWATRRPSSAAAARRRSLIRPLVHEPMNTTSIFWPRSGWPGWRSM